MAKIDRTILLIGVGNRFRGDDGIGVAIVRALRERLMPAPGTALKIVESNGEGTAMMQSWGNAQRVYVFDAVMSLRADADTGRIHRLDAANETLPADFFKYSSHAFGLAEAVELARVLGRLPEVLVIYGIETASYGHGDELSPAVSLAGDEVVNRVIREIEALEHAQELRI